MSLEPIMLKLSSDTRNIALVESFVERAVEQHQIAPDVYGNLLITLTEAVNNAIIHGNSNDESKTVQIHLKRNENCLAVSVTDEGEGFDHTSVPDPTSPENLLQVGGRGVFLMQQLSDGILFHNNGSTVEMRFNL